jgi:hypothetical protein
MSQNWRNSYSLIAFWGADTLDATNDTLQSFRRNQNEGFRPFPESVLKLAIALNKAAQLWGWTTDAFPGRSGEILLSLERGSDYYDIILEIDGSITVIHEIDDQRVSRNTERSLDVVLKTISKGAFLPWRIYDSFARESGVIRNNVLPAWHFATPRQSTAAEYQSSTQTVLKNKTEQYAHTSKSTTASSSRQYCFG